MTLVNLHLLDNLSRVCTYHEGVNHYLPSKFEVFGIQTRKHCIATQKVIAASM